MLEKWRDKMEFGRVEAYMTMEEAVNINDLLERDKPKAVIQLKGAMEDYFKCPKCKELVYKKSKFCSACGQRLDTENFAL
jgi:NAD-dependent SIR2 family protein deacetylase